MAKIPPPQPTRFKRGSTFSFAVNIPATVPAGYFKDWEIASQIRRAKDSTPRGFITTLGSRWISSRRLVLFTDLTDDWPIGPAEMDVVFINGSGFRQRAQTVQLIIEGGPTR